MEADYIAILGAYLTDLTCRTNAMPAWGETLHGKSFLSGPGGKGSNQAIAAVRAGAPVQLMSRVGDDTLGHEALATLKHEGVGTHYLGVDKETTTGIASIIVDDVSGENAIIIVPSACNRLDRASLESSRDFTANAGIFVSQLELPTDTCLAGIESACAQGTSVVLNPAPAVALPRDIFPKIRYITPNQSEAETLVGFNIETNVDAVRAAEQLRDWGVEYVLITLGGKGVLVSSGEYNGRIPAIDAGELVDTTGAGDAFNGGLVTGLFEGLDIEQAARFGCATAALSVTRVGTAPSMPERQEIEALLKEQPQIPR